MRDEIIDQVRAWIDQCDAAISRYERQSGDDRGVQLALYAHMSRLSAYLQAVLREAERGHNHRLGDEGRWL